ncbi:MAG TPA: EAL domain-containing protein, partial [Candidatus Dormibacteraeota bacterium]|nr:EAL domain-containing protein [Candidatus Dormibacteraeota bacterium]
PEAASLGGVVLTARDVTQRREADEALRQSEANFRALFTDNPQPMWVFDANTLQFLEVNEAALEKYGYSREEFLAMRVDEIRPSSEVGRLKETLDMEEPRHFSREWRHRLKDGRIIFVDITSHRLTFAGHPAVLVLAQDITERRELDDRLRHQAFHDTLTGLANRALFRDRVEQAVARGGRGDTSFAVLFIDLDNFKAINDSVGHTAGDVVLCEVARRLRAALRPSDTAARFGGDEFAVLIDVLTDDGTAIHVARRIADSLNHPVEAEGDTWFVSGSIGIAYGSHGAESVDAVLRNADVAMYDAKRRGRGQFAIFEPAMHESVLERMAMETELRQAIARDELSLVYQPQVDLRRARITGVEALVRWRHPRRGPILPGDFVPMAEEAGLIADLDAWVLRHATAQVRAWSEAGIRPISVAVNVSSKDFSDARLVERIAATVAAAGLQPAQVELEVTETAAFETGSAGLALTRLRELGFRVAIDDFGIGFSMLARLQDLPVDRLKIDRTFVEKITFGEDEAPIVSGIIAMAHSLRMEVVAEGVETSEQLAFLRRGGCDYGQGYRLGRPMPAEAIEPLLRDRAAAPPSTEGG